MMRNNAITKGFKKVLKTHVLAFDLKIKVLKKNIANFLRKDNSRQLEWLGFENAHKSVRVSRFKENTLAQIHKAITPMGWFNHSLAEIPIVFSGWDECYQFVV
ncbi:virulence associated protein VapD [Helicobacter pylori]|nr:virulence associated protein VapD [Helicobacter pylori]